LKITPRTEGDAHKAARRTLLKPGLYDARIREAGGRPSKAGNDMVELVIEVPDADGNAREFRDYLTNSDFCAVRLRHACEAVGALARYDAGEIAAADFPGQAVRVRIGVEKRRGWPDRNVIEDYASADRSVVRLREAS